MHTMHATRLADWWSSLAMDWQAEWKEWEDWKQAGVMAVLWYHLLVITPDSLLFQCKCLYLYKSHRSWVSPSLSLFGFLLFIYLQYITLTDYILTIPLLIRRGVRKSEHVSEPFKLFSSKRFGQDVCNLIICGTMSKMDCLGFYMMSNQMILCVDVFGSIMESRILSQLDYRSIVN